MLAMDLQLHNYDSSPRSTSRELQSMRGGGSSGGLWLLFAGWMEEEGEGRSRAESGKAGHEEQPSKVRGAPRGIDFLNEPGADGVGHQSTHAKNHHIEEALRAGADIFGKVF